MASASSLLCEDQFLCSICLDVFTEPVSTPCGHNFCKACITGYWASLDLSQCPLCKETFYRRPELRVNTGYREIVERFKQMSVRGRDESPAKPGQVPCDVCLGVKLKALKTCLVCLASYCQPHLEPHQRVPALKKHKVIDPVANLEDRVCKKHDKILEFFCTVEQMCVCIMCLKDDHAVHITVPLEEEFGERKAWLEAVTSEIKKMEIAKSRSIQEIKRSIKQSKKDAEKEVADVVEVFTALVASLGRNQAELIEVIEEKQKVAEKQAKDFITELEQGITELKRRRTELEPLTHTEDHLRLLQSLPSPHDPPYTKDLLDFLGNLPPLYCFDIGLQSCLCVGTVRKAVAQLEKTLSQEIENLSREVKLYDGCKAGKETGTVKEQMTTLRKEMENLPLDKLMMIQQCYAVDVTLDADTAYCNFILSEDGKQVRCSQSQQMIFSHSPRRFKYQPYVFGKEGFSSGKFYYEVQLRGTTSWVVGVGRDSFDRNLLFLPSTEFGFWTMTGLHSEFEEQYYVNTHPSLPLYLRQKPERVGVFVDYEEGEVSFYDVGARALIHSFRGCTFSESVPPLKALFYSLAGSSLISRPKLYPIVGVFIGDDPLIITPVGHTN
ncbi:E3 ubiquitin-protein ligase TRIM39-like [Centroberyx affinis]|uniref:E3 ubiquitin-protein ligase TRIM39-like n=1 Tax=Centroberyx affinis TaxID=166261 RepID=UPI003A5BF854